MTDKDFVNWITGYVDGVHPYSASPKQWQLLKEEINNLDKSCSKYILTDRWTTNIA